LILSAVPESFSLVLSEAWAAGVPVIAPASGAFVERLRLRADRVDDVGRPRESAGAGGLLLSDHPSDEEILDAVDRARQISWHALPTPPTAAQAADRHLALYRAAGFITTAG
jgi:glycosyltransferase involved in cell wall biosynthesis